VERTEGRRVVNPVRLSADELPQLLGWSPEDFAPFVKDPERLRELQNIMSRAFGLAGANRDALKSWLRKQNWALGNKTPEMLFRKGQMTRVGNLLEEFEAGTLA